MPRSTVARVLEREGLGRWRPSRAAVVRYQRPTSRRAHPPRHQETRSNRARRASRSLAIVATPSTAPDGSTSTSPSTTRRGSLYAEVLADECGATCAAFFRRAARLLPSARDGRRAAPHRQRRSVIGLTSFGKPCSRRADSTPVVRDRTAPAPTARRSALSRRCSASGPTSRPYRRSRDRTQRTTNPGSPTTIAGDRMEASPAIRHSLGSTRG